MDCSVLPGLQRGDRDGFELPFQARMKVHVDQAGGIGKAEKNGSGARNCRQRTIGCQRFDVTRSVMQEQPSPNRCECQIGKRDSVHLQGPDDQIADGEPQNAVTQLFVTLGPSVVGFQIQRAGKILTNQFPGGQKIDRVNGFSPQMIPFSLVGLLKTASKLTPVCLDVEVVTRFPLT